MLLLSRKQISAFATVGKSMDKSTSKTTGKTGKLPAVGKLSSAGYATESDPYDYPFLLTKLITPEHCQKIINLSVNKLIESEVVGGNIKSVRNSKQCWISKHDPIVSPIFEAVSKAFDIPFANAEDLQVVRYEPGQFYNEHHDSCCDNSTKCNEFASRGGQRKLTVLIYLNDKFTAGKTRFKNLNLEIKPDTGDAIVFYPLARGTSKCHPLALHAGMPVESGEKWIANLWYREDTFR